MPRLGGRLLVAAVGKIKEKHWQAAQTDYVKRIGRYTDFQLVEVKDAVARSVPEAVARQREGEQLLQATADYHRLIALTPIGKQVDSPELADFLQKEVMSPTAGWLRHNVIGMRKADPFAETIVLPDDELATRRKTRWVFDKNDHALHPVDDKPEEPAAPDDKPASG
jgi:23S rRNA (pseudouridine1915-N3)-methyltransferase